ncbi:MAG: hypothetical protein GXP47_06315 [Acidobacteria bacterium]|nr:hypothetical protein [Acidobacteriota bacterium]
MGEEMEGETPKSEKYRVVEDKITRIKQSFQRSRGSRRLHPAARAGEHLQGEVNYLLGQLAAARSELEEERSRRKEAEARLQRAELRTAHAALLADYNHLLEEVSRLSRGRPHRAEADENLRRIWENFKSVDQVKECIIGNVSHELRTPSTIALLAVEAALMEDDGDRRKRYLEKAVMALERQNRVIENLLEAALAENREVRLKIGDVNIREVAKKAAAELEKEAAEKGIEIRLDVPDLFVRADFAKIKHALLNLIHNSIKFTEQGGRVRVSARRSNGMVEVSVEDTGVGIPEQVGDVIFDRLFQVDPTESRRYGGTGMGLAAAKDLIEVHGGRIWFRSSLGEGSKFHFTLPVQGGPGSGLEDNPGYLIDKWGTKRLPT